MLARKSGGDVEKQGGLRRRTPEKKNRKPSGSEDCSTRSHSREAIKKRLLGIGRQEAWDSVRTPFKTRFLSTALFLPVVPAFSIPCLEGGSSTSRVSRWSLGHQPKSNQAQAAQARFGGSWHRCLAFPSAQEKAALASSSALPQNDRKA